MNNLRIFYYLLICLLSYDNLKQVPLIMNLTNWDNYTRAYNTCIKDTNALGFSKYLIKQPIFRAKFYDTMGKFLGSIGVIDDDAPTYIVSSKMLFKYDNPDITPQEIVKLVGTEIIEDRTQPFIELRLHVGVFKLPPKEHRVQIKSIIEQIHIDSQAFNKIDSIDYEIGGCGYYNNAGKFLHLRAINGKPSMGNINPSVEVFNAINFKNQVDSNHQLITSSGYQTIAEKRIEYTWHTHPPKTNSTLFQQMPSIHDFNFANSYQYIKQHFLISLKYKYVYYYSFDMPFPTKKNTGEGGVYNIRISYDDFFSL